MNDNLFNFLVATDQLDEFLGKEKSDEIPKEIVDEILSIADDYNDNLLSDDDVQDILSEVKIKSKINYEILYKIFKENIDYDD